MVKNVVGSSKWIYVYVFNIYTNILTFTVTILVSLNNIPIPFKDKIRHLEIHLEINLNGKPKITPMSENNGFAKQCLLYSP